MSGRRNAPNADQELVPLRTLRDFDDLKPEWERLYADSAPRNPFLSYVWTRACWDAFGRGELFILTLREKGRLIGIAPLCIDQRAGFRVLRFIADGRGDYLGFLCASDCPDVEQRLLQGLVDRRNDWDLAILRPLVSPYSTLHSMELPATVQSHRVEPTIAPYMAADADWDELHSIGPPWLDRTRKRLSRFLANGWVMERFIGMAAAAKLGEVAVVEARSWKARDNVTRLQPGPGQELFRRAFQGLGEEMELWLASIEGRPAAYQINFTLPDRLWIYQLSYDLDFHKTRVRGVGVGTFLGYAAAERAWRAGAREYDYMSGDDAYKADRTTASRTVCHRAIHPRTLRGWAAYSLLLAPRWRLRNVAAARAAYGLVSKFRR